MNFNIKMRKYFVKIESPTFELCVSAWCSFCSFLAFLENLSFTKPNLTFSYLKKKNMDKWKKA